MNLLQILTTQPNYTVHRVQVQFSFDTPGKVNILLCLWGGDKTQHAPFS